MNFRPGTTEGGLEARHILLRFLSSLELGTCTQLVFLIGPVRKRHHFFVAFGKKANRANHPGEEASGESTSGETEHEDSVSIIVIPHCKAVACNDMLVEGCTDTLIHRLTEPALDLAP